MKNSKKGFTLVELIIVVAVIALLAAVLIPTFSSLISKANQAKDEALVSNLNKAIALSTEKYDTVYDVLGAVKENAGFDVAKISASVSEHEILWDSVNYCFVYKTEKGITGIPDTQTNKDVKDYQYWRFVNNYDEIATSTYSVYWYGAKLDSKKPVNVSVGFDAGNVTVDTVNYNHTVDEDKDAYEKVILRTEGGTLTINAAKDSVEHYNTADKVDITAVAPNSYHEYGNVKALVVSEERVVVNEGATITTVVVTSATPEVIVPNGADITVYAPIDNNNIKYSDNKQYDKRKEFEDKNKENFISGAVNFAGGAGTEADPYLIATSEQALAMENASGYFKFIADVVVTDEIYMSKKTYVVDLNGHSVKLEYADGVKPNNGSVFYIGGKKGNLTINDSSNGQGKVIGTDESIKNKVTSAVRAGNYGKLTINGGHFYGTSEGTSCIFVYTSMSSGSKATVVINGGIFETATPSNGTYFVLNHQDNATAGCTITVNGGKFKNYNPGVTTVDPVNAKTGKIVLGTGCTTTQNGEWYIVSK